MNMLIRKSPKINIKTWFLVFSDNLDQKYIKKNIIKGTPKPSKMDFGIINLFNLFAWLNKCVILLLSIINGYQ